MARMPSAADKWREAHRGRHAIITMTTILCNLVSTQALPELQSNAVMDDIHVHRFDTKSPPMPKGPARDVPPPADYDDAV